jgi:hypothetical protein
MHGLLDIPEKIEADCSVLSAALAIRVLASDYPSTVTKLPHCIVDLSHKDNACFLPFERNRIDVLEPIMIHRLAAKSVFGPDIISFVEVMLGIRNLDFESSLGGSPLPLNEFLDFQSRVCQTQLCVINPEPSWIGKSFSIFLKGLFARENIIPFAIRRLPSVYLLPDPQMVMLENDEIFAFKNT